MHVARPIDSVLSIPDLSSLCSGVFYTSPSSREQVLAVMGKEGRSPHGLVACAFYGQAWIRRSLT